MDGSEDRMHLVEEDGKRYAVIELEQKRFIENGDPRPMYVEVPIEGKELEVQGQEIGIPESSGVEVIAQDYEEAVEKAERAVQNGEGTSLSSGMENWMGEHDLDQDNIDELDDLYGD